MSIIETKCWVQKPVDGYFKSCFKILGFNYDTWIVYIIISLLIGFLSYYIYLKIKKKKIETKDYIFKSSIISFILLIMLLLVAGYYERNFIIT